MNEPTNPVAAVESAPGTFFVNGLEITYVSRGRTYISPYATAAELSVQ